MKMYLSSNTSNIQKLVSKIQYYLPDQSNIDHGNFINCAVLFVFFNYFGFVAFVRTISILCLNIIEVTVV